MSMIVTRDLTKSYQRGSEAVHALRGISLTVDAGEFVSLVGPSGSGKTALLTILGCLESPTSGSFSLDGIPLSGLGDRERVGVRRNLIGFVFQQFFLIPTLTVRENIELPLMFAKKPVDDEKTRSILAMVGLESRGDHLPHQISGGEMQRAAIGRALIHDPRIILADEPTGNLDSENAERVYHIFRELADQKITLLVVTHNHELAGRADRIIRIKDGLIIPEVT
jgi:ABC-type lipoprotein export system ATPase subunit